LQRAGGAFVMLLFHLVNAVPLRKKIIFGISKSEEERGLLIFLCVFMLFSWTHVGFWTVVFSMTHVVFGLC
jgi:hypothetical protein